MQSAKDRYYEAFLEYIRAERKDKEAVISTVSDEDLGTHFKKYFFTLQVCRYEKSFKKVILQFATLQVRRKIKNADGSSLTTEDWPKLKFAEWIKSMIKCSVYEKDGIDLTDPYRFPNAKKSWGSFVEKLKDESKYNSLFAMNFTVYFTFKRPGRADTKHHEEIPPDTYEKITKLFFDALEVCKNRGSSNYQDLLLKIPFDWQHLFHQIIQYGVQVFMTLYLYKSKAENSVRIVSPT